MHLCSRGRPSPDPAAYLSAIVLMKALPGVNRAGLVRGYLRHGRDGNGQGTGLGTIVVDVVTARSSGSERAPAVGAGPTHLPVEGSDLSADHRVRRAPQS